MSLRLWPRTLAARLVIVTAAAVLLSNLAVLAWFERGREQLTESAITERLIDRAVSGATLLASIPANQRSAAARALHTGLWEFQIRHGRPPVADMTKQEKTLAAHIQALLPPSKTHRTV